MNIKVKKIILREVGILLIFVLILLISNLIYFRSYNGIYRMGSYLKDGMSFMQLIPVLTFFYPVYILVRIVRRKPQKTGQVFILAGLIAFVSGILSFFWASLMYVCANMDFVGFFHLLVMFLSPVLALIGVVCIIIGIVKAVVIK